MLLDAKNIIKNYDTGKNSFNILKGVSISINQGDFVAITGPSGAGKTTLLNVLSGIDQLTDGKIMYKGEDIKGKKNLKKYLTKRGFIFQQFNLIGELTALENIMWPMKELGYHGKKVSKKELKKISLNLLDKVGLKEHYKKFPSQLSGGQQQRVAIARALIHKDLIFADEPTGALDTKSSNEIENLLHKLNKEMDVAIVMVTHDIALAKRCKKNIHLIDGVISTSILEKAKKEILV